jgi:3-isopropylmalate/(R)-2-methylmalate dehydratase large subunit
MARIQIEALDSNCQEFGILEFDMADERQGIVHVMGPEQGATLPGMTIVCGDSHTGHPRGLWRTGLRHRHLRGRACARHPMPGATQVEEHAGAGRRPTLGAGVTAKDIILAVIGRIGTAGGTGYTIEFAGSGHPEPVAWRDA